MTDNTPTVEEIGAYWDIHLDYVWRGLPAEERERQRARYIEGVLANPAALRGIAEHADEQKIDLDRAFEACKFAVVPYMARPGVRNLPAADQIEVAVRAALGHLIGAGLITVKPERAWPATVEPVVPAHLEPDIDALISNYNRILAARHPSYVSTD